MTNTTEQTQAGSSEVLGPCPMGLQHPGFATIEELPGRVDDLETAVSGKQDELTAGENITIVDNVISATGGAGDEGVFVDSLDDLALGDEIVVYAAGYSDMPVVVKSEAILSALTLNDVQLLHFQMPVVSDFYMPHGSVVNVTFGKPYDQPAEYTGPYVTWYDPDTSDWKNGAGYEQVDFASEYQTYGDLYIKMLIDVLPPGTTGFSCNPDTSDSNPCMYFAIKRMTHHASEVEASETDGTSEHH